LNAGIRKANQIQLQGRLRRLTCILGRIRKAKKAAITHGSIVWQQK
jgi:hypothetical protein